MIGLVGSGNMAQAFARGLGEQVLCTDSGSGHATALAGALGWEAVASNAELADRADVVVLAHKPAALATVAAEIGDRAKSVASLLAGTSLADLSAAFPKTEVARAMPNLAVEARAGITCLVEGSPKWAVELFERVGVVVTIPERLMDAATAVGGVAPAYVALVAEAWVDAAVEQGLPEALAATLVLESLAGSSALLRARAMDTLAVRREVASPGGVTARGLAALERGGLRSAFADATAAVLK